MELNTKPNQKVVALRIIARLLSLFLQSELVSVKESKPEPRSIYITCSCIHLLSRLWFCNRLNALNHHFVFAFGRIRTSVLATMEGGIGRSTLVTMWGGGRSYPPTIESDVLPSELWDSFCQFLIRALWRQISYVVKPCARFELIRGKNAYLFTGKVHI